MKLEAGGFAITADEVGKGLFLHSLTGSGGPKELQSFLRSASIALDDALLFCTTSRGAAQKLYARMGFVETGEEMEGHTVMVRFPKAKVDA